MSGPTLLALLIENPVLLLFIVAGLGSLLGRIRVAGFSFGVAAVLFTGLAVGSLHPDLKLPEFVYLFGLVLCVYTIGLTSGPGFFASLRRKGLRDNALVLSLLLVAAGLTVAAHHAFRFPAPLTAGLFTGALTNTPALAAVLEALKTNTPAALQEQVLAEPVIAYSLAYPMGVIGSLIPLALVQRLWKPDAAREARTLAELGYSREPLVNQTLRVTNPAVAGQSVRDLMAQHGWKAIFGRVKRAGEVSLVSAQTTLELDDLVSIVAPESGMAHITEVLGESSSDQLSLDRHEFDYRRMFVSNPEVAGRSLAALNLPATFGAIVSRVRRGDTDLLPHRDTILELGDRVRVVAPRTRIEAISHFFGDSYRALSEIDVATLSVGVALGVLVGALPLPLPGGLTFKLGLAGGPLLVALLLGKVGRIGPLLWSLPYSASLTLRQLGLILFLAGIGTRSGYAFVSTLAQGEGLLLVLAGAGITCLVTTLFLVIGRALFHIPMGLLAGMLAGLQTQPAVLAFAIEQSDSDLPTVGYTTVYPLAIIAKILLAQLLLGLLG